MDDLFNRVLEKEKIAQEEVAEARQKASALLLECEQTISKKIKEAREAFSAFNNSELEQARIAAAKEQETARKRCEQNKEERLANIGMLVEKCSDAIVAILSGEK